MAVGADLLEDHLSAGGVPLGLEGRLVGLDDFLPAAELDFGQQFAGAGADGLVRMAPQELDPRRIQVGRPHAAVGQGIQEGRDPARAGHQRLDRGRADAGAVAAPAAKHERADTGVVEAAGGGQRGQLHYARLPAIEQFR